MINFPTDNTIERTIIALLKNANEESVKIKEKLRKFTGQVYSGLSVRSLVIHSNRSMVIDEIVKWNKKEASNSRSYSIQRFYDATSSSFKIKETISHESFPRWTMSLLSPTDEQRIERIEHLCKVLRGSWSDRVGLAEDRSATGKSLQLGNSDTRSATVVWQIADFELKQLVSWSLTRLRSNASFSFAVSRF